MYLNLLSFWENALGTRLPAGFLERVVFLFNKYRGMFFRGMYITFILAFTGTVFGCLIGLVCGALRTIPLAPRDNILKRIVLKAVRGIIYCYVELFRGTPMIVQAMVIYYGLKMLGFSLEMMTAAIFIVSINTGAYMAESVRGGIESIDPGQTEGAKAIGMNHANTMLYIILPQALRNIMPQIGNNLIINIKDTSVLNVIGTVELYFQTRSVAGTYYTYFEAFTISLVMYLFMTVVCSRVLRFIEKKIDGADSYDLATPDVLAHTSGMLNAPKRK